MRGAAFLSGLADCAVVDIGGTTSRRRHAPARLPARGGDRGRDRRRPDELPDAGRALDRDRRRQHRRDERATVGPQSVGYELTSRALVFGGDTLTATDIAVAAGLRRHRRRRARRRTRPRRSSTRCARIERADRGDRRSDEDERRPDPGRRRRRRHRSCSATTLPGASRARQAGALRGRERDRRRDRAGRRRGRPVFSLEGTTRADARSRRRKAEAIDEGGRRRRRAATTVADRRRRGGPARVPAGNATRIRVKAVGDLDLGRVGVAAGR